MEPTYWIDLFTATTWHEFVDAGGRVTGFREKRWNAVKRIKPGDLLVCYLTGVMRWIGLLRVMSPPYLDNSPIWESEVFACRLKVQPVITLSLDTAVPMSEVIRDLESPEKWGGLIRASPTRIPTTDGVVIQKALEAAASNPVVLPLDRPSPPVYRTPITRISGSLRSLSKTSLLKKRSLLHSSRRRPSTRGRFGGSC